MSDCGYLCKICREQFVEDFNICPDCKSEKSMEKIEKKGKGVFKKGKK